MFNLVTALELLKRLIKLWQITIYKNELPTALCAFYCATRRSVTISLSMFYFIFQGRLDLHFEKRISGFCG